uniref:Centrosomal protein 170Aa n=1 Tax=Poecilia formosa TaxID=48698 RepID=A0A096LWA9_POEFO
MSVTSWFLVSSGGTRHRLPREMIFVGRDDCELMLQSRSVDKQHAVINYEPGTDEHKVKDLGSLNGTFVNDVRIQEQMYITLKLEDKLRFGYDTNLFTVVRGELTVPEEALKHEKFTSGLQLSKKPSNGETTANTTKSHSPSKAPTKTPKEQPTKPLDSQKAEEKLGDSTALPRGTPLYGQPSWWGDGDADDENSFKQETKSKKHDGSISVCSLLVVKQLLHQGESINDLQMIQFCTKFLYFEVPTKEGHMANNGIHEIPTKDTEDAPSQSHTTAAQGHASFTIEFDNTSPGKVTIKDHVSKFASDHHRSRTKKSTAGSGGSGSKDLTTLQAAMMASESKVADWLAHNDPTLVHTESTEDDSKSTKSIKSDVPVHLKRLKVGSKHEDGTQSDSENGLGLRFANRRHALEERLKTAHNHAGGGSAGATATYCKAPAPIPATVTVGAPTAARVLLKQRSEDQSIGRSSASTGLATGSPTTPSEDTSVLGKGAGTAGGDVDDNHSDKGTYTIELENKNPEEEEARRMIDKISSPNASGISRRDLLNEALSCFIKQHLISYCCHILKCNKEQTTFSFKYSENGRALVGDSSWVSQWASLAANQARTDPEGSGAEAATFLHKERGSDAFESAAPPLGKGEPSSSLTDRKRRTLPQLPVDDPRAKPTPKALRSEIGEKQDTEPQEKENKGDGESPTPMEDGEMTNKRKQSSATSSPSKGPVRGTERRKRSEESNGGEAGEGGEKSGKALVRQGSFTIEKPSSNVPPELIPRINRGNNERERSDSVGSMDTATLLKDTEAVMAFLEAKLRDENKLDQKSIKTPPSASIGLAARTDSISPESDVDTASTASHAAAEAGGKTAVGGVQKRKSLSSMHREKSNMSTTSKTTSGNGSARERLERKAKGRTVEATGRTRSAQPGASSRARQPSLDLTDDDQTSSFPISDILSSDQETYSGPLGNSVHRRGSEDFLHSKLDSRSSKTSMSGASKTSRNLQAATASSLNKQASLPQPRPTRASLLRRARLGDTSDTDLADADRVSVASEVSTTSSTSKPPSGRKGMSRLDLLAQPRRNRVGSVSARSDSECTVSRPSTASPRLSAETALRLGLRSTTPTENQLSPRMRANSVSKLNEPKTKTTTSGYCSPTECSRWRRLPPEYGSTSEEEFGSSRNSAKHGARPHVRPHHLVPHRSSRLGSASSSGPAGVAAIPGGAGIKHRMKEQEEYIRDWTAHSEEIARISQDLAKDLAILAREIHDVAGEIDSVSSSGTAPSTTVSTAATTPGSAIDTREELVDRVFDESLKFRKIPPVISSNKPPEINGKPVEHQPRAPDGREPRALRRRTWNREEAVLDSLLIHSVSQLSTKIRHSVDRTAGKIRILFKDKDRNWDEIESKLKSESEAPLLKTSNKEISSILLELKRVEKQLQVINVMVDPDGTLDALASLSLTS